MINTPNIAPNTTMKHKKKICKIRGSLNTLPEYLKTMRIHRVQKNMWPEKTRSPQFAPDYVKSILVKISVIVAGFGGCMSSRFSRQ